MEGAYFSGIADHFAIWDKDEWEFTGMQFYDLDAADNWIENNGCFDRYSIYL